MILNLDYNNNSSHHNISWTTGQTQTTTFSFFPKSALGRNSVKDGLGQRNELNNQNYLPSPKNRIFKTSNFVGMLMLAGVWMYQMFNSTRVDGYFVELGWVMKFKHRRKAKSMPESFEDVEVCCFLFLYSSLGAVQNTHVIILHV